MGYTIVPGPGPAPRKRRFFHRFNTADDHQLTLIWRWNGLGIETWPPFHNGRQKRSINFGFGYLTWRIK